MEKAPLHKLRFILLFYCMLFQRVRLFPNFQLKVSFSCFSHFQTNFILRSFYNALILMCYGELKLIQGSHLKQINKLFHFEVHIYNQLVEKILN